MARAGRWGDIAAVTGAKAERTARGGRLRLNELSRGRLFRSFAVDEALRRAPGMVSMDQRRFLLHYARRDFTGAGEIVDLGCWLGSSTVPLVLGLDSNARSAAKGRKVYAYDLFRWDSHMAPFLTGTPFEGRYEEGDDFQDALLYYAAPWRDRIELRPGDLGTLEWSDGPIEFLFVDAMKSLAVANNVIREFFAALTPGVSLVFHHDFAHYYTPWIPLIMHRLRDYLVPVRPVPRAAALFRSAVPIPADLREHGWSLDDFDDAEVDAAFAWARTIAPPEGASGLAVSRLMLRLHQGDLERAARERDDARREGVNGEGFDVYESQLDIALAETSG
jgi:hypothetical protein